MAKNDDVDKHDRSLFLYFLLAGVLIAIIASFYSFYIKKDYDFFVETQCNPEMETCFFRDCENEPDICPSNNLSYYNQYTIKARDFKNCENEDCTEACKQGTILCLKTECTESDLQDGVCIAPSDFSSLNIEN